MNSDFYINSAKFQDYSDRAIDWFIRGFKFKRGSAQWRICEAKHEILMEKAMEHLRKANKWII